MVPLLQPDHRPPARLDSGPPPLRHPAPEATLPQLSLHTPLGPLSVAEQDGALVALDWGWGRDQDATALLRHAIEQLHAYFDGDLTRFDLPLAPAGTPYRQRIWRASRDIPFGQTCSYAALAARAGGSARSIGGAMAQNPLPIIVPCHRVVGATGLGGYSGGDGLASKRALLRLEQRQPRSPALPPMPTAPTHGTPPGQPCPDPS